MLYARLGMAYAKSEQSLMQQNLTDGEELIHVYVCIETWTRQSTAGPLEMTSPSEATL